MIDVEAFVIEKARRHPELRRQVHWSDVRTIAARDGVRLRLTALSTPARLIGMDGSWEIQVSDELDEGERAFAGMHEMAHFWCDREEGSTFYSTREWGREPREDFANTFAWYCTSAAFKYYAPDFSALDD